MDAHDFTGMGIHTKLSREEEDEALREMERKRRSGAN
jgi:hypothetical protein